MTILRQAEKLAEYFQILFILFFADSAHYVLVLEVYGTIGEKWAV
jgi:hypothetical protein